MLLFLDAKLALWKFDRMTHRRIKVIRPSSVDDQYDWFMARNGPIIDVKRADQIGLKETVQILFAMMFIGFVGVPMLFVLLLVILGIWDAI
jgi:hypothetical protein